MPRPVRYCLPILNTTWGQARTTIADQQSRFDFFELWVDTISGWDEADLEALCRARPDELIIVWDRGPDPAGRRPIDPQTLLSRLAPLRVVVGLDAERQPSEIEQFGPIDRTAELLVSRHDYTATPSDARLIEAVEDARTASADVVKVATHCQTPDDAVRLLGLGLRLKSKSVRHVILGMGPHGNVTRIFGTQWSNEWIYAPESSESESAPGQLTRDQLGTIFEQLSD